MKQLPSGLRMFGAACLATVLCANASAALTVIGTMYREDQMFPELDCYWNGGNYPNACPTNHPGVTLHVYVKNTGASSATITDAILGGYSMATVIKRSTDSSINEKGLNSIYFNWDNPPAEIVSNLGEPVWWKADPRTVAAGAVAQVAVRLRYVPTTNTLHMTVGNSAGNISTNITKDGSAPRIQSIGYSEDRKQVYLHWRRSGGAAPASVYLNGTNVTSLTTTVGDATINYAASVINLTTPLPHFSYNVFQGIYSDGKVAAASQRAWTNKFIYATYCKFSNRTCDQWIDEAMAHGFNNIQMNLCGMCLGTAYTSQGYGYTIDDPGKLNTADPDMWFVYDEPDIPEWNQSVNHCGTGLRIPCIQDKYPGTLVQKWGIERGAELRNSRANVPITVNLDSGGQPYTYYHWGPAVDVLQSDSYYEPRLSNAYFEQQNRIGLYGKAKLSYAIGRVLCAGAEPNPSSHLLYSTEQADWPMPTPKSKRFEVYYTLAGGSKSIGYWWLENGGGLDSTDAALWKELGLCGNEIKTARDLIVRSTPVNMTIAPNNNWIWARGMASGIDSMIVYVVNDNYFNDITGCHVTNVPNANITNTLPSWMVAGTTTAFEIGTGGKPADTSFALNGNKLTVFLGTLSYTRMIIITTNASLRGTLENRFTAEVRPGLCTFAPELCTSAAPAISQHPFDQSVPAGDTANFSVFAGGSTPLSYRWQKNNSNLNNGGHYSGVTGATLTITGVDTNDVASYRCVVTNSIGSATSSSAMLTLATITTNACIGIVNSDAEGGFTVTNGNIIANGWAEFEGPYGTNVNGYDETVEVHGGAHSQRIRVWGANGTSGGCYQRVPVNASANYSISVWMKAFDGASRCYLGVDPAGGSDMNAGNIVWSSFHTNQTWVQKTVNVTANSGYITVFYKVASSDGAKRNGYFDDASPPQCVDSPPTITQQPANQSTAVGGDVTFSVGANGTSPLSYQWQKNNTNVNNGGHYSGTTTPMLLISGADFTDMGSYRCVVTNALGSTNSAAATLTVTNATLPPEIIEHPSDLTVAMGDTATFEVLAGGSTPLSYRWQKNNVNLTDSGHYSGSTTPALTISDADDNDAASYRCVVTNAYGTSNTISATLTVVSPNPCLSIENADFERGFTLFGGGYIAGLWNEWETDPDVVIGYDETTITHGGGHAQRIRVWGGTNGSSGGVYQRVPVITGQAYTVSIWMYAADSLTVCSLGVDPAGGTNASSGVTWMPGTSDTAWVQRTWAGTAAADHLTVYCRVSSADNVKRNGYFDDAEPGASSALLQLGVQRNGNDLTLLWAECPPARLERAESLSLSMSWTTVTNEPAVTGGLKSVTLPPTGNTGYFRLVLE